MPVLRKRAPGDGRAINGLYIHSSPPRVLQLSSAHIKQLIRTGDIDKLEQAVLEGQGKKLVGEYSADYKTRTFLKSIPTLMSKIALLHDAVNSGRLEELKSILDEEPDKRKKLVLAKDESGVGLLHKAVYYDLKDIYKWLIERCPHMLSLRDSEGRTAFHYTAMCKDPQMVQKLLTNAGADPSCLDIHQHTAKYYMDHKQDLELPSSQKTTPNMRKSIVNKDSLNFKKSNIRIWIHQRNLTNLQQVVWEGHGSKLLVEHSNNPKIKKFLEAVPHIMGLIKEIHTDVQNGDLGALKNHVSPPIPSIVLSGKDANGLTPLHKAVGLGKEDIAEYIVNEYPNSVNITDNDGRTPLHFAALLKDNGKMTNFLIEHGADESALDNRQKTAAYYKTRNSELDSKLLNVTPECPRSAKESFAANFDWSMLAPSLAVNGIKEAVKKIESLSGNTTDNDNKGDAEIIDKVEENGNHAETDGNKEENNNSKGAENDTKDMDEDINRDEENHSEQENGKKESNEEVISPDENDKEGTNDKEEEKHEKEAVEELNHKDNVNDQADDSEHKTENNIGEPKSNETIDDSNNNETEGGNDAELNKTSEPIENNELNDRDGEDNNDNNGENEGSPRKSRPTSAINSTTRPNSQVAGTTRPNSQIANKSRPNSQVASESRPNSQNIENSRPNSEIKSNTRPSSKIIETDENQNENHKTPEPVVEGEGVIEGVVNGEDEVETLNNEGQNQRNGSAAESEEDIRALVDAGNMEQLAALVLNGEGERLVGQSSDNPELQSFLENVPVYMSKINRIHEAARSGSLRDLQAALDRRKFAIAKDSISPKGASPLHVAVMFGNTSIVRYLAGRFPETVQVMDEDGRTPLHYAAVLADNGHYYNLLVHLGADPRIEDKFGHTPEYYRKNQSEFSHRLLLKEFGAEENVAEEMLVDKGSFKPLNILGILRDINFQGYRFWDMNQNYVKATK